MRRPGLITVIELDVGSTAGAVWSASRERGARSGAADSHAAERQACMSTYVSCRGANLEGQPNWKSRLASDRMPSPPHDISGHTRHHADDILSRIIKESPAAVVGGGYECDMPDLAASPSDEEIRAVLELIQTAWPEQEGHSQAEIVQGEKDLMR